MKKNQFSKLLGFLGRLNEERIPHSMNLSRDDALMVVAFAPGEYGEVEFLADGDIEIERYRSDGEIHDESALKKLFALWSDEEPALKRNHKHDAIVRK